MEIEKRHILETIEKMIAAGKILPQKDRIRYAKDQAEEQQKVLAETVNLWWNLFSKQHISVGRWEQATDRALMLNGIPKLETSIINPALMSVSVAQVEKEYLEAQQVKYEQEKKEERYVNPYPFPEMGKLIAYHMAHHLQPLLPLPEPDTVRAWARNGGLKEEVIDKNMLKLRVYYCYGLHSKRDKQKMPIRMVEKGSGIVGIEFIV